MRPTNCRELCAQIIRAKKDPAKITHAKMAFVERGLGAKQAHAESPSVKGREQDDLSSVGDEGMR